MDKPVVALRASHGSITDIDQACHTDRSREDTEVRLF